MDRTIIALVILGFFAVWGTDTVVAIWRLVASFM